MMNRDEEKLDELLVKRAIEGLDDDELVQLAQLSAGMPEQELEWVDRLVGELDAEASVSSELPLSPADRDQLLEATRQRDNVTPLSPSRTSGGSENPGGLWRASRAWIGWATAAALAFAWLGGTGDQPAVVPEFDIVAASEGAVVIPWSPGGDAAGADVTGEVAWSGASQTGVMRFRGLLANIPADFQYQLWIFDAERDERYPVDGGVFDVPEGMDVIDIPIRATLPITTPTLFAVSVERPGGVVVSDRQRIATVAEYVSQAGP